MQVEIEKSGGELVVTARAKGAGFHALMVATVADGAALAALSADMETLAERLLGEAHDSIERG